MFDWIAGALILGTTLAVIMIRPCRVPETAAAAVGAVLMVFPGIVHPDEALHVRGEQWNVFGFFLGLRRFLCWACLAAILAHFCTICSCRFCSSGGSLLQAGNRI
jgi:hypothetical protein